MVRRRNYFHDWRLPPFLFSIWCMMSLEIVGSLIPLFSVVFGNLIDSMGINLGSIMDRVDRNVLQLIYLSIAALVAGYTEVTLLLFCGEANSHDFQEDKIRLQYTSLPIVDRYKDWTSLSNKANIEYIIKEDRMAWSETLEFDFIKGKYDKLTEQLHSLVSCIIIIQRAGHYPDFRRVFGCILIL